MANEDVLSIVKCGDPVLRRVAEPLKPEDLSSRDLQRLITRMRVTMETAPGVGLAAPQVGESIQLAVLADGPERWGDASAAMLAERGRRSLPFTVLVNPVLTPLGDGFASFFEGCLSVDGLTGIVRRHASVRVEALDAHGEPIDVVFSGWPARIAQHEVDHLFGVLYLDKVETRSLSSVDNYFEHWVDRPREEVGRALGFELEP